MPAGYQDPGPESGARARRSRGHAARLPRRDERTLARPRHRGRRHPRPRGRSVPLREPQDDRPVPGDRSQRRELPRPRGKPRAAGRHAPRGWLEAGGRLPPDARGAVLRGPAAPGELRQLLHRKRGRPGPDLQRPPRPRRPGAARRADPGPARDRRPRGGPGLGAGDDPLPDAAGAGVMRAMLLDSPRRPLRLADLPEPEPGPGQILIAVKACGVCRTDLHVASGDLPDPKLPLVLGHEIVGTVAALGTGVSRFQVGDHVGVPWLGWTCGECGSCRASRENLCDRATFTCYTLDGGYAERAVANAAFAFAMPEGFTDAEVAPLLCAGLIGYRTLVASGPAERLGIYGFGAAGHIVAQVARHQGPRGVAFTRPGHPAAEQVALGPGAGWAGDADQGPPEPPHAAAPL